MKLYTRIIIYFAAVLPSFDAGKQNRSERSKIHSLRTRNTTLRHVSRKQFLYSTAPTFRPPPAFLTIIRTCLYQPQQLNYRGRCISVTKRANMILMKESELDLHVTPSAASTKRPECISLQHLLLTTNRFN